MHKTLYMINQESRESNIDTLKIVKIKHIEGTTYGWENYEMTFEGQYFMYNKDLKDVTELIEGRQLFTTKFKATVFYHEIILAYTKHLLSKYKLGNTK